MGILWTIVNTLLRQLFLFISLIGLCTHPTWMWVIALPFSFVVEFLIHEWVRMSQAAKTAQRALSELRQIFQNRQSGCLRELSEQEVRQYISGDLEKELSHKLLGIRKAVEKRRREAGLPENYPAVRVYVPLSVATQYTAFITPLNSSQILLSSEPSNDDVIERFKVLHELSHATPTGLVVAAEPYLMPIRIVILIFAAFCSDPMSWSTLAAFFFGGLLIAAIRFRGYTFCEVHADLRALAALTRSHASEVVHTLLDVWKTDQDLMIDLYAPRMKSFKERLLLYRRGVEREERMHTMKLAQQSLDLGQKVGIPNPPHELFTPIGLAFYSTIILLVVTGRFEPLKLVCVLSVPLIVLLFQPRHLSRLYDTAYRTEFSLEKMLNELSTPKSNEFISISYSATFREA